MVFALVLLAAVGCEMRLPVTPQSLLQSGNYHELFISLQSQQRCTSLLPHNTYMD